VYNYEMKAALLLLPLLLGQEEATVLTRAGRKLVGNVIQEGAFTRVGAERLPAADVLAVFRTPAEAVAQAEEKYRTAKAAFAAAEKLDVGHPARNDKLHLAIEQAQAASGIYQAIEMAKEIQVLQQFIRLCRGSSTSDLAGEAARKGPLIPLVTAEFKAAAAEDAPERPWTLDAPLTAGLAALARDLENPDADRRLSAVKALLHPPSHEHFPSVLKLLEAESDVEIVRAIGDGLSFFDPGPLVKSLGWAKKAPPGPKRAIVVALARAAGDRAAFDFLASWFADAPPDTNADRALFAGAFRQLQPLTVPWLRELLTKTRQPKLQIEILRQMGVLGDKAFGGLLVKALPAYPRDAAVALRKLGKPGVPFLMEGARSTEAGLRQPCLALLRVVTGVNGINMGHFEKWWDENRKAILEEEAAGRPAVTAADFEAFE
jgi:hypothetical protein